jgi:ankyrin repeat protein
LIVAGANVNAADSQKVTILDKAKKTGREPIVKLLEEAGAKASETPAETENKTEPAAEGEPKTDAQPAAEAKPEEPKK